MVQDGRETIYTPEEIDRFNEGKDFFLEYRKKMARAATVSYDTYYESSVMQQIAVERNANVMRARLKNRLDLWAKDHPIIRNWMLTVGIEIFFKLRSRS